MTSQLKLRRDIMAVCSEILTKTAGDSLQAERSIVKC